MIRFISDHWAPVAVPLDAPTLQRHRAVLEAVARGGPDAPEQLARALAWLTETEARFAPVPLEAPLAPLLRVSRMLAALDPAPGSTLSVDEHIEREALARAVAWATESYAPFRAALEAALEADDPDAALPALAPPPEGTEAALAWLAIEPELAAVWCGTPAPEDVPPLNPELMLGLLSFHPNRPWAVQVQSHWRERLGADPSAEAAARLPRLAARRPPVVPRRVQCRLTGHTNRVVSLLAHPFRPLLLSGSVHPDCSVRVWDLDSRSVVRTLAGHTSHVYGLALCPDGKRIASGSVDKTVRLWDLESGACLRTLAGHSREVWAVAWEAAGSLLASGSRDNTVRLWHADSGALRHTLEGHSRQVNALAAHPNATADLLASGSADRSIRIWRFSSGAHVRTLAGHTNAVCSLAASAAWLVSGSWDKSVRVWSWNGICARVLDDFAETLWNNSLAWRDSALITLESDNTVRVWDTGSPDPTMWSCAGSLKEKASSPHGVAVVGDCVICAAPGDKTTIAVWAAE